jgi:hypothetical protein
MPLWSPAVQILRSHHLITEHYSKPDESSQHPHTMNLLRSNYLDISLLPVVTFVIGFRKVNMTHEPSVLDIFLM